MAVWSEHLTPLAFDVAWSAVLTLERNRSRQPAIADFHEAYGACRPQASAAPALTEEEWGMTKEQAKANLRVLRAKLEENRPKW